LCRKAGANPEVTPAWIETGRARRAAAFYETGAFGNVPVLDTVAVASDEGWVTLFAVNRYQTTPVALDVDVRSLPSLSAASHVVISDDDPDAVNTLSSSDRVVPKTLDDPRLDGGRLQAVLPPLSWNMIRLS
jgi:alpha-N-arabinofuranosidase